MTRLPTEIPDSLKGVDIKALLRKRGIYKKRNAYAAVKEAALPIARQIVKGRKKAPYVAPPNRHAQFTNERLQDYWEKQIHVVEVVELKFEKKVEQFIQHVEKGFLSRLDAEVGNRKEFVKFVQKDYFSDEEDDLLVQAQIDFAPLLENIAVLAGQEANKLIGVSEPYLPFEYRDQIRQNVAAFTKSMLDTDRDALTSLITNGLQDGKSIPEIRSSIESTFSDYSKNQAQRISRTEVLRASNQASLDAYKQSGVVEGKQWLTAGATDECADYEGQIESLDDNFYSDTDQFADGDPPLHPNCRCVLVPVLVDTKAWIPDHKKYLERIEYLESLIDKRTKDWKQLKEQKADDSAYIKALEKHLGITDE
jgi:SPP1 gp7 family putative phage head morphogenesis protein